MNNESKKMTPKQLEKWISLRKKCSTFKDKRKEIPRKEKHKKKFENI